MQYFNLFTIQWRPGVRRRWQFEHQPLELSNQNRGKLVRPSFHSLRGNLSWRRTTKSSTRKDLCGTFHLLDICKYTKYSSCHWAEQLMLNPKLTPTISLAERLIREIRLRWEKHSTSHEEMIWSRFWLLTDYSSLLPTWSISFCVGLLI